METIQSYLHLMEKKPTRPPRPRSVGPIPHFRSLSPWWASSAGSRRAKFSGRPLMA